MKRMTTAVATTASVVFLLCSTGVSAQSWFDKLKNKAKDAVEDSVDEQIDSVTNGSKESTPAPAGNPTPEKATASSSSQNQQSTPVQPSGNSYGETVGAADNLIKRWPYHDVKGKLVKDIVLKGVKLGMPLPEAIEALDKEGFSRVTALRYQRVLYEDKGAQNTLSRAEYYNLPPEQQGEIIRSYVVELEAVTPSDPIMAQLPAYPEPKVEKNTLSDEERKRCEMFRSRSRAWAQGLTGAEVRDLKDKCSRASGDAPPQTQDPLYVSRIWYGQKFISGEKVDYAAFREKAKETFGEPTYVFDEGSTQAAGAAFNRSSLLWWVDSALVPKSKIYELLQKSGNDDRAMVFRDFIHPGNADNAFYPRAYKDIDDMDEALSVAYAPYMAIGYERGSFVVDIAWPFLAMEKSYRRLREEQEQKEAQPEADVTF